MDLDEYFFYEKRKNQSFRRTEFAKKIGITDSTLSLLVTGKKCPTSKVAYLIEKHTNHVVSGWGLIKTFYDKELENEV